MSIVCSDTAELPANGRLIGAVTMYNIISWCNHVLCVAEDGSLVQTRDPEMSGRVRLEIDEEKLEQDGSLSVQGDGALSDFVFQVVRTPPQHTVYLRCGQQLVSAQPTLAVEYNREHLGPWETFHLLPEETSHAFLTRERVPGDEKLRFVKAVEERVARAEPITLHLGCGNDPRAAFLNIDAIVWSEVAAMKYPNEYFVFPFADVEWGIADEVVDYVYHEDLIEHLTQIQQIQLLAEAWRVMRKGAYHRINTPNLITAMSNNSNFSKGIGGVYQGEMQWGHQCILTPRYLEEIALMVGYRAVVYTTKDNGVSIFAEADMRPGADRDPILGNIYADLLK